MLMSQIKFLLILLFDFSLHTVDIDQVFIQISEGENKNCLTKQLS